MSVTEEILIRLRENIDGDPWHGPSLATLLEDVTPEQATTRIREGAHTIGELLAHMTTWRRFAVLMLRGHGDHKIEINGPEDWPSIHAEQWPVIKAELHLSQVELVDQLERFDDIGLDSLLPGGRSVTFRQLMFGVLQHDVYHTAQIALIKRLIA
jgi:uncharacterized damage-inducible protein DinB